MKRTWLLISALSLCTMLAVAQGTLDAWIGTWDLDVDGHMHQLYVQTSDRTCDLTPWCALDLVYRDNTGNRHPARIVTMENKYSLTFEVKVDEHTTLRYNAYMFTGDRNRLAGTTKLGGATRGFSGIRR